MDQARSDVFGITCHSQVLERKHFQTAVKWEIISLKHRTAEEGNVISPIFECSKTLWKLTLCFSSETPYLQLDNVNEKSSSYTFYYQFTVLDEKGNITQTHHSRKHWSSKCLMVVFLASDRIKYSKKYLLEQNLLTVRFYICVEDDVIPVLPSQMKLKSIKEEKKKPLRSGGFSDSLMSDFEELYNNPELSDVTLKLGDDEFQAHKSVLIARSKVFAAMFQHNMSENQMNKVDLVQMEAETVKDMLRYIYCGKVRELSPGQALNLYVAADRYDLQELKTFCREIISHDISVINVCDIASVAELHNDESLINVLKSFLAKHGKEIIKTEKWKSTAANQPLLCTKMFEWAFSE